MFLSGIENIVMVGAGNVATHLSLALKKRNKKIVRVYSRTEESAKILAGKVSASYTTDLNGLGGDADLYIVSVRDSVLEQIAGTINLGDKLVVHTSGSLPMDLLKHASLNYGVLYPIFSFSKEVKLEFSSIPICVEANNQVNGSLLFEFAKGLSGSVYELDSAKRKVLHLAVIFVNNFSNNMYSIAKDILDRQGISFDMVKPIIHETARKITDANPLDVQTGPAMRGDMLIVEGHLAMLSAYPEYKEIYDLITKNIIKQKYKNG